jgi:hypothetical protein
MLYKFVAQGLRAGKTFNLLDKYQFTNGELVTTGKLAKAYKPILVDFYGCTVERVEEESDPLEPSTDLDEEDEELETTAKPVQPAKPATAPAAQVKPAAQPTVKA